METKFINEEVIPKLRLQQKSYRTEQTYVHWIVRHIRFHKMRHPREMGAKEIERRFCCAWGLIARCLRL